MDGSVIYRSISAACLFQAVICRFSVAKHAGVPKSAFYDVDCAPAPSCFE